MSNISPYLCEKETENGSEGTFTSKCHASLYSEVIDSLSSRLGNLLHGTFFWLGTFSILQDFSYFFSECPLAQDTKAIERNEQADNRTARRVGHSRFIGPTI